MSNDRALQIGVPSTALFMLAMVLSPMPWMAGCGDEAGAKGSASSSSPQEEPIADRPSLSTPANQDSSTDRQTRPIPDGEALYLLNCSGCHGKQGKGNGPIAEFLFPKPRNFTSGSFAFRTTPYSQMPSDDDLLKTIAEGIRWSAMPPFRNRLSIEERKAVLAHVKGLTQFYDEDEEEWFNYFKERGTPTPMTVPDPPAPTPEVLKKGKELFLSDKAGCIKCHGETGAGDGPSAKGLMDRWDNPIKPRDLRLPIYQAGNMPRDIFLRVRTGIPGTPMPIANMLTDEEVWAVALFVRSLQATPVSVVERGRMLFGAYGCAQCHGPKGAGGTLNPNYVNETIPQLNTLAEKMFLQEPEDVARVVAIMEDWAELADDARFKKIDRREAVLAQYRSIRKVIREGNPAGKKDPTGPEPAIHKMPSWAGWLSDRDIDAIITYLLTLQQWEEDEDEDE